MEKPMTTKHMQQVVLTRYFKQKVLDDYLAVTFGRGNYTLKIRRGKFYIVAPRLMGKEELDPLMDDAVYNTRVADFSESLGDNDSTMTAPSRAATVEEASSIKPPTPSHLAGRNSTFKSYSSRTSTQIAPRGSWWARLRGKKMEKADSETGEIDTVKFT